MIVNLKQPLQRLVRPQGIQVEASRIFGQHMKVARLSALCTGHIILRGKTPGTHFCQRLYRPQGHRADRKIKSITNLNEPNGNRNCDLPGCSSELQPTAPPRAPILNTRLQNLQRKYLTYECKVCITESK
jgi:hypothetical protein